MTSLWIPKQYLSITKPGSCGERIPVPQGQEFQDLRSLFEKPERIEALSMVMVLTLLIYSVAEWLIRKRLKEQNEFVPNQANKPNSKTHIEMDIY